MYLNFYKIQKKPFSLAPDPEFLYLSQQHKDALGAMIYGTREKEGFVSVVGEVGTGKTTVVKSYLQKASRNHILPVVIFNSNISFPELLKTFLVELGVETALIKDVQTLNELVRLAYRVMLEKSRKGLTIVLIIDEAQNMPVETLGRLCILSNFETTKTKLIQIVLVGQPELKKKLEKHELRQLRQRIAYRALITPLSADESVKYIEHRLSVSSQSKAVLFTKSATSKIVKYSKGVPRVINVLCENSLVAGYGIQKKPVSRKLVNQVIAEYEGKQLPRTLFKNVTESLLVLALAILVVAIFWGQIPSTQNLINKSLSVASPQTATIQSNIPGERAHNIKNDSHAASLLPNGMHSAVDTGQGLGDELKTCVDDNNWQSMNFAMAPPRNTFWQPVSVQTPHVRTAVKGDTISELCLLIYGSVNSKVLSWVKIHNPHIVDIDEIQVGEMILFPQVGGREILNTFFRLNNRPDIANEEVVTR